MTKMLASLMLVLVIRSAPEMLSLWSLSAEEPVLSTAIVESGLTYLKQHGDASASGLWQVEPATHDNLYTNFLNFEPQLGNKLGQLRAAVLSLDENLATNLMHSAAVCRLCYYREPDALPDAGDIEGQVAFWKQRYNTIFNKGTVSKYVYKVRQILREAG